MSFWEIVLLAVGLAMDAFSVSICKGLAISKPKLSHCLSCGLYFGIFQGVMPLIGYYVGRNFVSIIESVDHWIAFFLLLYIGGGMILEVIRNQQENEDDKMDVKTMLTLAVATSIDALSVGVSFAFLQVNIVECSLWITVITFAFSFVGVLIGHVLGGKLDRYAKLFGGVILIFIGTRILLEHLGILA